MQRFLDGRAGWFLQCSNQTQQGEGNFYPCLFSRSSAKLKDTSAAVLVSEVWFKSKLYIFRLLSFGYCDHCLSFQICIPRKQLSMYSQVSKEKECHLYHLKDLFLLFWVVCMLVCHVGAWTCEFRCSWRCKSPWSWSYRKLWATQCGYGNQTLVLCTFS